MPVFQCVLTRWWRRCFNASSPGARWWRQCFNASSPGGGASVSMRPHQVVALALVFQCVLTRWWRWCFQWRDELEEILQMALHDTDQWVAMVGDILRAYPSTGALNSQIEDHHAFFHEVLSDLKKLGIPAVD